MGKDKKRYEGWMVNRSIRGQIMSSLLLGVFIPILLLSLMAFWIFNKRQMENYQSLTLAESRRVKSIMFDITTSLYLNTETLVSSESVREVLSSQNTVSKMNMSYRNLYDTLSRMKQNTASISSIHVYTNNGNLSDDVYIQYEENGFSQCQWYEESMVERWNYWVCTQERVNANQTIPALTLVRKINPINSPYESFLVVSISYDFLNNLIKTTDEYICTSLNDDYCFYSTDRRDLGKTLPIPEENFGKMYSFSGLLKDNQGKQHVTAVSSFHLYKSDQILYVVAQDMEAMDEIRRTEHMYLLIIMLAMTIPLATAFTFSKMLGYRMGALKEIVHKVANSDYEIPAYMQGKDEISDMFQDIKKMVSDIQENEKSHYQKELKNKELINQQQRMKLKMMFSQINPHFLYNTLEMIQMQAISNKDMEVADSIMLLGRTMHYVLETTLTVMQPLARELEQIENYLRIQKLRFGDRVNWNIYVDESMDTQAYYILPLLLQPIVENAIIHGLEERESGGRITIIIGPGGEDLLIVIKDNGNGMDAARIDQIMKGSDLASEALDGIEKKTHIGIANCRKRIKLVYGEAYDLMIRSETGAGTTVTLKLPLHNEKIEWMEGSQ